MHCENSKLKDKINIVGIDKYNQLKISEYTF